MKGGIVDWTQDFELPESRVDLIVGMLKDGIISGQLKPGERILEARLAKQIGVSRSPIREAIRRLESEGLFTLVPQKGTFVTKISKKSAEEIYTVRGLLEIHAVCSAIQNNLYSEESLRNIHFVLEQIQLFEKQQKFIEAVKMDWQFHLEICKACQIDLIIEILNILQGRIWLCMFKPTMFVSKPGEQSYIHQQIFDSIKERNLEQAKFYLEKHHQDSLSALLAEMGDSTEYD